MARPCMFNECMQPAQPDSTKCSFHRNRTKCEEPNCPNQAYARNRCVRHGAKKTCAVPQCQYNRRFGSYCSKHADNTHKKQCSVEGCDKQPHARGKCVRHGGGRLCKADGCTCHARIGVFCSRHFNATVGSYDDVTLGAPMSQPDWLDWQILKDLMLEMHDEVDAKTSMLRLSCP